MKPENLFSRYNLLWAVILCYLLPLLAISVYGSLVPREPADWNIFGLGFFITSCGSLILFGMLTRWEKRFKTRPATSTQTASLNHEIVDPQEHDFIKRSLEEAQQTQIRLLSEIDILTDEIQQLTLSKNDSQQQIEKIQTELEQTIRTARQELEQQQNHIRELQESLAEQKGVSEKKQQQMLQQESKVNDLTYEIKTLLRLAEAHSGSITTEPKSLPIVQEKPLTPPPIKQVAFQEPLVNSDNPAIIANKASQQLKHCLDIAQKIKGSQRFGSQIYTFLDSPADSFSIDLRRLCDRLRAESENGILLFSPKDNHLLFANNQIKLLTGWSPEKFTQNFFELLLEDSEWKFGINSLVMRSEAQIQMHIRTRSGPTLIVNAHLGIIPTGIFRNHIIAILYTHPAIEHHHV